MRVINPRDESGFTMLAATIAMTVVSLMAIVVVSAVNGDNHLTLRDLEQKRAYEAAKAGINDYAFHLSADPSYWQKCANVPGVNLEGKTEKKRAVPGETGATYAIEMLHATTSKKECDPYSTETAAETMLESSNLSQSFRIRSNGYSGQAHTAIVATFQPPSFLDYVYFTQRETLDPLAYGFPFGSEKLKNAERQCSKTWEEGRYDEPFYEDGDEKEECEKISFVTGDYIRGPLRTNDALSIDGNPVFGRDSQDQVEVGAEKVGWHPLNKGSAPIFNGPYKVNAGEFQPPESNAELEQIAQPEFVFTGQVKICLNEKMMTVGKNGGCTGLYNGAIPSNGVVYVKNGSKCSELYSPFTTDYPQPSGCGNAYVKGEYTGKLTIGAANSVIIDGSLIRKNSSGTLGLIANNFIRVYHPCNTETKTNEAGSLVDPTIDAAMLALKHSIIVDHYNCGASLGTLSIEGALAQYFRGPVGTNGGKTGYLKNYEYDDRLKYQEPPYFLKPKTEAWIIGRETID